MVTILVGGFIWASCSSHQPRRLEWDSLGKSPAGASTGSLSQPAGLAATNYSGGASFRHLTVTNGSNIMTLASAQTGKIVSVHPALRFVVIDYSLNLLPEPNQRVFVYRRNLKIGQVKITGPQRQGRIVADIVEGDPQIGDDVRKE